MPYTRDGQWIGPCGCTGCDKWADCDYCGTCSPEDAPENVNLVEIVRGPEGYDVTVALADGFSERIEALYDIEDALTFGHMHVSYQTNKYLGRG